MSDLNNPGYYYIPPRHNLQHFNDHVGFAEAYKNYWLNTFNFRDRTTRPGFWWPLLLNFIIWLVLTITGFGISYHSFMGLIPFSYITFSATEIAPALVVTVIASIWYLVNVIPFIAISIRRLHDTGKRWPRILIGVIPIAGFFISYMLRAYEWFLLCLLISIGTVIYMIVVLASMSKFPLHNKIGPLDQV